MDTITRENRQAEMKEGKYDVGGVLLDQPFKLRRLGHFAVNVMDVEACKNFYCDILGFRISDTLDVANMVQDKKVLEGITQTKVYFLNYCTDHHSFAIFPKPALERLGHGMSQSITTVNQCSWQTGSLREVAQAITHLTSHGAELYRIGRDMPGSNWHGYVYDPERHVNEVLYGMEQIGWEGRSKPLPMYARRFTEKPDLPQIPEYQEVAEAAKEGVDFESGYKYVETRPAKYDVGGILMPRPFRITRIGPIRLFVEDMGRMLDFYTKGMGFIPTETVTWKGHKCHFLRCNTEHHSVALYPIALREELGLSEHTTLMSFGVQVAEYRQLKDAVSFLEKEGVTVKYLPPELFPGIDYSAFAIDPDGHAVQLYYYMEQIGWNGKPRPKSQRPKVKAGEWPDAVVGQPDAYEGEQLMGPWA